MLDFLSALNVLNLQEFWTSVWVIFIHYTGHPLSSFNFKNGVVILRNVLNVFIYYFHISISLLLKHFLSWILDFLGCLCNFLIFSLCLLIFLFYILWYFLTLPSFSLLFQFSSCYHIMTFKELFFCSLNNHFYSILVSFPIPSRVLTDFLFLKSSGGWSLFLPGYFSCFLCVCLS